MIGHYLLTLSPDAEHDVLTGKMDAGSYGRIGGSRCLVGWAADIEFDDAVGDYVTGRPFDEPHAWDGTQGLMVEMRYDWLCQRFGVARINATIRNRILSNQARRVLAAVREMAVV